MFKEDLNLTMIKSSIQVRFLVIKHDLNVAIDYLTVKYKLNMTKMWLLALYISKGK